MAKLARKALTAVGASAAGAAVAYFLDPDRGRSRRTRTREQAAAKLRQARREAESKADYVQGRVEGARARAEGFGTPRPPDDVTLANEVKAALSALPFETTDVTVEAVDGAVTLRGELSAPDEIERTEKAVAAVSGVSDVTSHLHLPGTPAPNKAEAQEAGGAPPASASGDGAPVSH